MIWPCQAFEHDADHGKANERGDAVRIALEVARQAPVSADPRECSFDNPSPGENDEAMKIGAFDDLDLPATCGGDSLRHLRSLISGVGEDALDKGKERPRRAQQAACAIAVLNVGGKNAYAEQKAERVNEDMALAPRDLLARIITLRVERGAPF
jgi:hypothetical protein